MMALGSLAFFNACTALKPIVASHVTCALCMAFHMSSPMPAWSVSPSAKKDLKNVMWSALSTSISVGMCAASSGVRFWKPFLRTALTTSRGALTAYIGIS